jgi:hypothetical protein
MSIVSMPVETSRPVAGHLIMMMPMTPPRHFSSINPREHVARVTTADNKEVGMGDLRGMEFSRRQAGTDVLFERRFTNKIDATMLCRPERPIAAKTRLRP